MALTVDNSPLSPTCNSYASLAGMLTYLANQAPEEILDAWNDLTDQQRAMYLVNATRTIDGLATWIGDKYFTDQKLKWPRSNAWVDGFLIDSVTFPQKLVDATYEQAVWMMQNDGLVSVKQSDSYSQVRVGPIGIHFNQRLARSSEQYFPDIVAILLADLGQLNDPNIPGATSLKLARLHRA